MSSSGVEVRVESGLPAPAGWDELQRTSPDANYFHRSSWISAVCRHLPGREAFWLIAELDGRPAGGMAAVSTARGPWRILQSSYDGTAGGIMTAAYLDDDRRVRVATDLLAAYRRLALAPRTIAAAMVVPEPADEAWGRLPGRMGWRRFTIPVGVIPLEGGPDQVKNELFRRDRRRELRRAEEAGCRAEATTDLRDLDAFLPIHAAACERWGIDPLPRPFLAELLGDPEGGAFLLVIRRAGELIGAHLDFHGAGVVTAWLGASSVEHRNLFVGTQLMWGDVVEASRRGASLLDIGGHGGHRGVASFKHLLGAGEERRAVYRINNPLWRPVGIARRVLSRWRGR